ISPGSLEDYFGLPGELFAEQVNVSSCAPKRRLGLPAPFGWPAYQHRLDKSQQISLRARLPASERRLMFHPDEDGRARPNRASEIQPVEQCDNWKWQGLDSSQCQSERSALRSLSRIFPGK